jgi:hypothetical protein
MKNLTLTEIAELVATCSASTDGGNFVVTQGKHYFSIDAYESDEGATTFVVDHYEVTEPDDWVFFFDGHSTLDQFTFRAAWAFNDPVEAALFYANKITERVLGQMLGGV